MRFPFGVVLLLFGVVPVCGFVTDERLDALGEKLSLSSPDGGLRGRLSGSLDLDLFAFEGPPPGVLDTDEQFLAQPRLMLFVDGQWGDRLYGFAQARIDRGFDPADHGPRGRLDEYALRFTPWRDGRLNIQAGQFGTVIGRWVLRHLPKANPFVSAPLPYENITRLTDLRPPRSEAYLTRELGANRYYYNPIIWGPAYTTGAAVSGQWKQLEWALEMKNASPFSRPVTWGLAKSGFGEPTWSGRLGWRPNLRWQLGVSASEGSFLWEDATRLGDFTRDEHRQRILLMDFSYAFRHLEVWGEWMRSSFSVPGIPNLNTTAWFVETRYRLTPRFSAAMRWNEQTFSTVRGYDGEKARWGGPVYRLDVAGTWRLSAYAHLKLELNWRDGEDGLGGSGWGGAAQLSQRF